MFNAGKGLSAISIRDLKKALLGIHRGTLPCPLTITDLTAMRLGHCSETLLGSMRGLEKEGVRAVLVAVLAERLEQGRRAGRRR